MFEPGTKVRVVRIRDDVHACVKRYEGRDGVVSHHMGFGDVGGGIREVANVVDFGDGDWRCFFDDELEEVK